VTKASASTVDPATLSHVLKDGERVILQDRGTDVAALVSLEDLRLIEQEEGRLDNASADSSLREPGSNVSWDEIITPEVWTCRDCGLVNITAPFLECEQCWLGICERCGEEDVTGGRDCDHCDTCREEIGDEWPSD
jgi:hypothetical protein